ncbi:hypothetical protein Tco_1321738 [Tanacetum coccineum]
MTLEAEPPSTYMRWMRCPPISASITIGLSCPSLFSSSGNEISRAFSLPEVNAFVCIVAFISVELTELVLVQRHELVMPPARLLSIFEIWPFVKTCRLIKSGLVMPCMNPDTLIHSGALFTYMLLALKRSMKALVDSPSLFLMW